MNIGNEAQFQIYQMRLTGQYRDEALCISVEDWVARAREVLSPEAFWYLAGASGRGETMRANEEAFAKWRIVPRVFRDVSDRDLSLELFGERLPYPVLLAPIGVQSILHADGEVAAARGAAKLGLPYIVSSASTMSLETIAEKAPGATLWFQLYWSRDRDVAQSFVRRAEAAGCKALVVTLDTPMMAWRERDLERAYLPFLLGEGLGNYVSDPAFRAKLRRSPEEDPAGAILLWTQIFGNPGLTWDDLEWLREETDLPLLLKGILHPDDAEEAFRRGADGIIVSNHGGRQVDGAVASLDALVAIRERVGREKVVLMDGGVRRGSDVVKAMALGATAVLVGRLYGYGLAVDGERGVETVLRYLLADFDLTMALSGHRSLSALDANALAHS
ncbi:alpha-hydroxy-acid oxidizing protein [Alicyclobacillus mali]|uniref:L-lactate oxidase n=1 Tax=Alicyclobacillus mali (ex Roth et al. 2021) TaxID=1123961 RepID=A0ABS0F391_9BACL|nr:alpha-hydroxy-acid oxidizing protein [Alicyclobacillus mali (ex Roth et al. 2021)]MBF8377747.1 alpha-hydroxy-acid oxidizing protein [Alicyclobacillus mali (ex Roth et al. 2021)]MCL6488340.1 alpha-hydroxy-acid oxidizing protein [Alicyclobacillus mali (ex Roth et al. 2021)]